MEYFIFILEIIGTVAFAISGATVGIKKSMDLFGVCCLGLTTACAGGLFRDIILGKLPPTMFTKGVYALTAIGVSVTVFLFAFLKVKTQGKFFEIFHLIADSLGLGIFTVVGMFASISAGHENNFFFTVFLGLITGVGGGLLRDIMAEEPPYIFVKHVYATAALIGACVCYGVNIFANDGIAMICGCGVILLIRLLAAHFRWSLPKINKND